MQLEAECLCQVLCGLVQRQAVVGGPEVQDVSPMAVGLEALEQALPQIDREAVTRSAVAQRANAPPPGLARELGQDADLGENLLEGHLLAKEAIVD